jgi:hypothetical protein
MQRCDIGVLVKDYVKPLMQALTVDIREYNMRLITTKCLNTAVMFMILFFGKSALKDTEYCDVRNVVLRHQSQIDKNVSLVDGLANDLMRRTKHRYVYYVMLTDGRFIHDNQRESFFPGHVMVWEKIPHAKGGDQHYYIYQSYINEYDYSGSLTFHATPIVSKKKMEYYLKTLRAFMRTPIWNNDMVRFWRDLTNVDTSGMLGSRPQDAFYLCYRKRENRECVRNLENLVVNTLKIIPQGENNSDTIFGDVQLFNSKADPLTNRQMTSAMTELLTKIRRSQRKNNALLSSS